MLVLSVCSVTAIKRFARESLRDCGEAVQNKWLFFQVAQHGALVEALLTTSSCLNLTKKKRQSIFCMLLKKMYVNPSSILMFTGLGSCYLFLFSFPAQPWGAVFSPTCLAALHALLPRAVQCPRWDGMSAGPGEEESVCEAASAAAQTGIPELAPTFCERCILQKKWVKSQLEHLSVHGREPWCMKGSPVQLSSIETLMAAPLLGASKRRSYASVVVLPDAAGSVCFK